MQIDPVLEKQAFEEGLAKYPAMAAFPAKLMWRELFQGGAFQLQIRTAPAAR